jgi:hypothetical protein
MSGLTELMGQAVVEHPSGTLEIRTDFAWQIRARQAPPTGPTQSASVARALDRRVSLQALVHLLLERGGFNRWDPVLCGRGDQASLRKGLVSAAAELHVNGEPLAGRLYVPERFSRENMQAVAQRRRHQLRFLHQGGGEALALVIGEYKGADEMEYGHRLWIRHMPDAPILVADKDWSRICRVFGDVLAARDADVASAARVLAAMLVRTRTENLYQLEALWLSLTTREWIPIAHAHELPLITHLVETRRRFIKPLHYDAASAALYPNAVLLDAGAKAVRLDIVSPLVSPRDRLLKERSLAQAGDAHWVWETHEPMPALPEPAA